MNKFEKIVEMLKEASTLDRIGTILYKGANHIESMAPDAQEIVSTVASVRAVHLLGNTPEKKIVGVLV